MAGDAGDEGGFGAGRCVHVSGRAAAVPGIDNGGRQIIEVSRVASGQHGALGQRDAGNESVAHIDGSSTDFTLGSQLRSQVGSPHIEDDRRTTLRYALTSLSSTSASWVPAIS